MAINPLERPVPQDVVEAVAERVFDRSKVRKARQRLKKRFGRMYAEDSMPNELPIDVVPGTQPPRFRWRQTVSNPAGGITTVNHVDRLPVTAEQAILLTIGMARGYQQAAQERDKLQAFKDWVHAYLDAQGVPKEFPDGPHTREGCRVGDRMDWLVKQLEEERKKVASWQEGATNTTGKTRGVVRGKG